MRFQHTEDWLWNDGTSFLENADLIDADLRDEGEEEKDEREREGG